MKRIRKILKGILVAIVIIVSIAPILVIVSALRGRKKEAFLDIISEWVADLMVDLC